MLVCRGPGVISPPDTRWMTEESSVYITKAHLYLEVSDPIHATLSYRHDQHEPVSLSLSVLRAATHQCHTARD